MKWTVIGYFLIGSGAAIMTMAVTSLLLAKPRRKESKHIDPRTLIKSMKDEK